MINMDKELVAHASTTIDVPVDKVWHALVTPEIVRRYMFGAQVVSDWNEGSPILWKGEWKGKPYEDKGVIVRKVPKKVLSYTHWSPLSGVPDIPENQHTVTIELADQGGRTRVSLAQDNNQSEDERVHSEKNWNMMLEGLKKAAEGEIGRRH
jgi:uncharacterized protein YndB with AHSA1/START domain